VFTKALLSGNPITIYGDGSSTRDFLHVNDLCNGIIKSLEIDLEPATVLHLSTGRETSVLELANLMRSIAGKTDHPIEFKVSRAGEVHRNFANYDFAKKLIGFHPQVGLEEGLEKTWKWFLSQGKKLTKIETTDS
jgi:UDP-glucose 4-epimerase